MSRNRQETFGARLVKLADGSEGLRATLRLETQPDPQDADLLHIRASDETIDRYEESIAAAGWRLENYLKNPVIQNAHQYGDILHTIGKAEKTEVKEGALVQVWRFAAKENPVAKIARDLYRGGFLKAASVGFIPLAWEDYPGTQGVREFEPGRRAGTDTLREQKCRRRFTAQELLEVSSVAVPANPNALALALKAGAVDKSDLKEWARLLHHLCRPVGEDDTGQTLMEPAPAAKTNSAYATLNRGAFPEAETEGQAGAHALGRHGAHWEAIHKQITEILAVLRRG